MTLEVDLEDSVCRSGSACCRPGCEVTDEDRSIVSCVVGELLPGTSASATLDLGLDGDGGGATVTVKSGDTTLDVQALDLLPAVSDLTAMTPAADQDPAGVQDGDLRAIELGYEPDAAAQVAAVADDRRRRDPVRDPRTGGDRRLAAGTSPEGSIVSPGWPIATSAASAWPGRVKQLGDRRVRYVPILVLLTRSDRSRSSIVVLGCGRPAWDREGGGG